VTGLGRDHDASATASYDVAEFLQHERSSIQINLEDRCRRGLRRPNTCGMDNAGDFAELRGRFNESMNRGARNLQSTITADVISATGIASVTVNTPSGNPGDVDCSGLGTSGARLGCYLAQTTPRGSRA
jgi:hypothetical protein